MKLKYAFISIFSLIVVLLLGSCQSESEIFMTISPTVIVTNTAITQPTLELPMTLSPLPTATEIVETISAPNPSPTALATTGSKIVTLPPPLATPTVIVTTLTPLPTLEGEELDVAVAELLANPMNCDLPCWWGAIPDVTTVNDIKHAMSPYNFDIHEYYDEDEQIHLRIRIGNVEEQGDYEINIVYSFYDTILKNVTVYYSQSISEVLTKYGQPDGVFLATGIAPAPMPVRLNLVYLQESMAFGYVVDGTGKNHKIEGCFAADLGVVHLRQPGSITSYKDFRPIFEADRKYLPLEEATDLTMDDFMQQFSDPNQPQCIETPIELWE